MELIGGAELRKARLLVFLDGRAALALELLCEEVLCERVLLDLVDAIPFICIKAEQVFQHASTWI